MNTSPSHAQGIALNMAFLLLVPSTSYAQQPPPTTTQNARVDVFGTRDGKVIDTGYLFVDGRYMDRPYKFKRYGDLMLVNGSLVRRCKVKWPPYKMEVDKDPGIPKRLTRDSTFEEDPTPDAHWRRKWRYLVQHFPREEVPDRMREYFLSLPFVKSAEFRSAVDKETLDVVSHQGVKRVYDLMPGRNPKNMKTATAADLTRWMDARMEAISARLERGECVFLFLDWNRILSIPAGRVPQALPPVAEVLGSDQSDARKWDVLELWDVVTPGRSDRKTCSPLVKSFKGSEQLSQRLAELLEKHPRRPRPLSYRERREIEQRVIGMKDVPIEEKRRRLSELLEQKRKEIRQEFLRSQQEE